MACPAVDIGKTQVVRLRTDLEWLPEKFRNRSSRVRIRFRSLAGERKVYRKRKRIPPSQWAPKNRRITYGPLEGSYYDSNFIPHMNGIIDTFVLPFIKQLGNCKVAQTGSSAGMETCLAYLADIDPGSALVVYPDRDTAGKRSNDYLAPVFKGSPRLRSLLTGVQDDVASFRIKLQTMLIYMGWAGSVTSMGNVSAKYLFLDETDKYPERASKKEAPTMELVLERVRAFKFGSKVWFNSTPSLPSGPIWVYLLNADAVFDFFPRCPDCGKRIYMESKHIRCNDEKDPQKILQEKLGRYICTVCGSEWDDRKRDKALQDGEWYARCKNWRQLQEAGKPFTHDSRPRFEYLKAERPEKVCFHSPGWISPLVSLSELAAAMVKARSSKEETHTFANKYAAEAYYDYEVQRKEDQILALRDDRPEGLVPGDNQVATLVAGVDTQDDGFVYYINALGWGLEQTCWHISSGVAVTFQALAKILWEDEYKDSAGNIYPIALTIQDAMGHRTSEVYDFCLAHPGKIVPYKGASGRRANPFTVTNVDRYPGTNKPIPGGIRLYTCDTHHYKDMLAGKLAIKVLDPGGWRLHAAATEEYAKHLCVEYVDERGLWQQPRGKAQHYWDASFMSLVAADILRIKFWKKTVRQAQKKKKEQPAANPFTGGRRMFG
ncbi:terminase gpA endonuclease subunit [Desulfogranum japonicum]|uniref:terminase gpA endonuclease subunit n=1 Tax=Desulfogranum japonicum TaxID=231447 RepID=UPI0003FD92C2|nr:terminase gpA endonuclease subunit [Desulfogranum japonicum]